MALDLDHYRRMLDLPSSHPLHDHYRYYSPIVLAAAMPNCDRKRCTTDPKDDCPRARAFDDAKRRRDQR